MKRNKSVFFGGLIVVLFSFAFIFLVTDFGSSSYSNIVDFGSQTEPCTPGLYGTTNPGHYCYTYFGSTHAWNADACACDSDRDNKVTCCQSHGGWKQIGVCQKDSHTYSKTYDGVTYSITCTPACASSHCNYAECSIAGTKKTGVSCSGSCPNRVTQEGVSCDNSLGTCVSGNCVPNQRLNESYWANMLGEEIQNTSNGNTVLMIYGGENFEENSLISFTVQEFNSSSVWWNPFSWFSPSSWKESNALSSDRFFEHHTISSLDEKRFIAKINGTDISKTSNNLTILAGGTNSKPVANITSPIRSEGDLFLNFSVGYDINFRQISTDKDDLLKIVWDFGDGNNLTIYNYSRYLNSSKGDVVHSYSEGNQFYTVNLTASEMSRSQSDENTLEIFVFEEGINVVPIISAPLEGVVGYRVLFSASKSYVVNCSEALSNSNFTVNGLKCKYILAPGSLEPEEGYNVSVRWREVQEGGRWIRGGENEWVDWNEENYGYHGEDKDNVNGAVVFEQIYEESAFRKVVLEIGVEVA